MHGVQSLSQPARLWWGSDKPQRQEDDGPQILEVTDLDAAPANSRPLNLFQTSHVNQRFRAGGLIDDAGKIADRAALHRLMSWLAERMKQAGDKLHQPPTGELENPGVPSGYTYLMQFIAHDMVDSVPSVVREAGALRPAGRNARQSALMLDTLYGAGPDEAPHAYAVTNIDIAARGTIPRSHLRIGRPQVPGPAQATAYCPYRDLARATPAGDDDLDATNRTILTEAFVADPRNDSHAFMSQITVLFLLLHNHIVGLLEPLPPSSDALEDAYRRFLCARMVVTMIYRNVIENDLLPRIIDDTVLARYRSQSHTFFDGEKGVPVEFTHGAFRFGHAMVRGNYRVRSDQERATMSALDFNSLRTPSLLPVTEAWFVDWARFFETTRPADPAFKRNYSLPIGPHYTSAFENGVAFPAKTPIDGSGLANRDLLSACYAGTLSVPALTFKLNSIFSESVRAYDDWRGPLRQWLTDNISTGVAFTPQDIDRIVDDPPLPFFVLFEAEAAAQGRKLGPIGSIIAAETIYGALARHALGFETAGPKLADRIKLCAATMFPDRVQQAQAALSPIGEIASMPALLDHLADAGLIPDLMPA